MLSRTGERRAAFAVFLLVVGLTAAFYRDFSYVSLRFGGFPVYVTEISILLMGALLAFESIRTGKVRLRLPPSAIFAGLYLVWGAYCLYRGRADGFISVRDSATNYYALFYFFVAMLVADTSDLTRLWRILLTGTAIAFAVTLVRIVTGAGIETSTGALRFHAPVVVGASAMLYWILAVPADRRWKRLACVGVACLSLFVIVVATQHRSAAVALSVSLLLWLAVLVRGRGTRSIGSSGHILAVVGIGIIALLLLPEIAKVTVGRLRTIGTNFEEFNAPWRLLYWSLLLVGFSQSPVVGLGFGNNLPVFDYRGVTYGLDPTSPTGVHNSFLFVLYKEGAIGLALLLAFCLSVLWTVVRNLRGRARVPNLWQATAAVSAFAFVIVFTCFNVVLEGPFMGMFFWIFAAMAELSVALADPNPDAIAPASLYRSKRRVES